MTTSGETSAPAIQPLNSDAFEAWQVFCQLNGSRTPVPWTGLVAIAQEKGTLSESELRKFIRKDELPAEQQSCSFPGCDRKVSPLRTALILPDGTVVRQRDSDEPVWRGAFLVLKLAEGGLQVRGFCPSHLGVARQAAEDASGERLHPMPLAEATARREGILASFRRHQEARETFEASLAGRSTAIRGRFGSAPRNSPANIGGRR